MQLDTLSDSRRVVILATDFSEHVQSMVKGVARYGKLQTPPWHIRWMSQPSDAMDQIGRMDGFIYFALPEGQRDHVENMEIPCVNRSGRLRPAVRQNVKYAV